MKSLLYSVASGGTLWIINWQGNYPLGLPDLVTIAFTSVLAGWFVALYSRKPRRLRLPRPFELPSDSDIPDASTNEEARKVA